MTSAAEKTGGWIDARQRALADIRRQGVERATDRAERKRRLCGAFRVFARLGFDHGVAGHITARDPERPDHFWVNPWAVPFSKIRVSDLCLVNHAGQIVEGRHAFVNRAAFAIHSRIHAARPDVIACAHAHSVNGVAWATLGRPLEPTTQDACMFFEDHVVYDAYDGVVADLPEADRIATALGGKKAAILQNHGLLTVGESVDEAAFWFVALERECQIALTAAKAGEPRRIPDDVARATRERLGNPVAGWWQFQPLWEVVAKEEPDFLDES